MISSATDGCCTSPLASWRVYDFGSRRKRVQPRAFRAARRALRHLVGARGLALRPLACLAAAAPAPILHGHDASAELSHVVATLPAALERRLKYFRPYVVTTEGLRLEGVFAPTALDDSVELAQRLWRDYALPRGGPTTAKTSGAQTSRPARSRMPTRSARRAMHRARLVLEADALAWTYGFACWPRQMAWASQLSHTACAASMLSV